VLVGGSNKTISLQPVSLQGGVGLNVAGGIGALALAYQPDRNFARRSAIVGAYLPKLQVTVTS
jgi:uncharacterized protein DUF992